MSMEKQCKETSILIVQRQQTPPSSGGSGDYTSLALKSKASPGVKDRTPVPSCRKFTIRSSRSSSRTPQQQLLAETIKQITSTPSKPRNNTDVKLPVRKSRNRYKCRRSLSFDGSRMNKNESINSSTSLRHINENGITRNEMEKNMNNNITNDDMDDAADLHMKQASRRVGFILMLNAWRQCRAQLTDMIQHSAKLEAQIDQQRLQIAVLRELINTDNTRVATANEETRKAEEAVVVAEQIVSQTQQENEELKKNICTMEEKIIEYTTEIKNEKNSILMVRSQVNALENQLTKEREKLSRLRDEKMHLVHKVQQIEDKFQQKEIDLETIKAVHLQLEERFDEQRMINAACMDEIDVLNETIKEMEMTNEDLENKYKELKETLELRQSELCNIQAELHAAKDDVKNLTIRNGQLGLSLHDTQSKLDMQCHRPWWSLAAELATGPINALHTAARMTLPALPQANRIVDTNDSTRSNLYSEYILKVTHPADSIEDTELASCSLTDQETSHTMSTKESSYTTIQE